MLWKHSRAVQENTQTPPINHGGVIRELSRQDYLYLLYDDAVAVKWSSMIVTGTPLPWTGVILLSVATRGIWAVG